VTLTQGVIFLVLVLGVLAFTVLAVELILRKLPTVRKEEELLRRIVFRLGGRYRRPFGLPEASAEQSDLTLRVYKLTSPYKMFTGTAVAVVGVDLGADPLRLTVGPGEAIEQGTLSDAAAETVATIRRLGREQDTLVTIMPAVWFRRRAHVSAISTSLLPDDPATEQRIVDLVAALRPLAAQIRLGR
jgi:hypothetical protein